MLVSQPTKIGKIGYLLGLMSVFLPLTPILDLFSLKLTLWDVPFLIFGVLLIIIAYILASKDTYMRKLGWGFLMWRPSTIRDRIATLLILIGGLWIVPMLAGPIFKFDPWGYGWLVAIAVGIALIIACTLVLTERESPSSVQEHDGNSST